MVVAGRHRLPGFDPRSRAGSDNSQSAMLGGSGGVSIRAPARGATQELVRACAYWPVSIHAPARGATFEAGGQMRPLAFQSTLPRGERRPRTCAGRPSLVSIHAPARGATSASLLERSTDRVSIHAPARGATLAVVVQPIWPCFDPRSRAGSDQRAAPDGSSTCFNPRSRAGSDLAWSFGAVDWSCFNPRSRAGSDARLRRRRSANGCVSIHAPARGATWPRASMHRLPYVSIHAPARGATAESMPWRFSVFRSTLPRGERRQIASAVVARSAFQSTLPRGERPLDRRRSLRARTVSIHAPRAGSDTLERQLCCASMLFQSTLPARGATLEPGHARHMTEVSIHAPARGATRPTAANRVR